MSLYRLSKLRSMASAVGRLGGRLGLSRFGRGEGPGRSGRSVTERSYRHLAVDPLEQRQLLSVTPMSPYDMLANESFGGIVDKTTLTSTPSQWTQAGQSLAVDDDGDFVVVWTRQDPVLDQNGDPIIDWNTGEAWSDQNVYARYYTDEVQRITLPDALAVDNVGGAYGRFSLTVGGNEVQKLTVTSTYEPYMPQSPIMGQFNVGFDVNGDGTIGSGENYPLVFNETTITENAHRLQVLLQGMGGALIDAEVEALNAREYLIHFGKESHGLNQPEIVIDPSFVNFSSGFYPAAVISTVSEPFTIENIPVSHNNPEATASVLEQIFLQTTRDRYVAPVSVGSPQTAPLISRYADWRISVTPVDGSLTQFDVTFVGATSKTNQPEMVFAKADNDLGQSFLGSSQIDVTTIKEPSPEFRVNDPEPEDDFTPWPDKLDQYEPAVAMDADGDFVITWTSEVGHAENDANSTDIYARRFRPAGWTEHPEFVLEDGTEVQSVVPLGSQFLVNSFMTGAQGQPAIGMDYDGNFTIAWASTAQEVSHFNRIGAQRYDRDGNRLGTEFIVVDPDNNIDTNIHFDPYVSMSDEGHILFTWSQTTNPAYQNITIKARLYAPGTVDFYDFRPLDTITWEVAQGQNSTSSWDADNDFLISWNNSEDNDNIGATSHGVFAEMYYVYQQEVLVDNVPDLQLVPVLIRDKFRANSASFPPLGNTDWPGDQVGSQALLDADGDIVITYGGYGPDVSDDSIMFGSYYTDLINANKNADLLPLFNPLIDGLIPVGGISGGVDAEIEDILYQAVNSLAPTGVIDALLAEKLGRLRAILESRANLIRGEANGVLFSRFDADSVGNDPVNVLASDSVANAQRDGHNARYIIEIHRTMNSGSFTVTLTHPFRNGSQTVTITPVYDAAGIEVVPEATRAAIELALRNATITGLNWLPDPAPDDGSTGPVDVRWVQLPELQARDLTPWPLDRPDDLYYVYEVTFQGECHDLAMGLSLGNSSLEDTNQGYGRIAPYIYEYETGDPGTIQDGVSAGIEPDGDYVIAWTQWERTVDGTETNSNIYFREFNEGTDTVGPRLTDFLQADGTRLKENEQITGEVSYVIVTFDEELMTFDPLYPESNALTPENWALMMDGMDGVEITGGISQVYFGMNKSADPDLVAQYGLNPLGSNKWEAVLILDGDPAEAGDQPLGNGQYAIVAKHSLRDVSDNPLGRFGYDLNGQDVGREFFVLLPGGVETPVNDQTAGSQEVVDVGLSPSLFPNSPQAIAGDVDSDYVVVWVDEEPGHEGVYAKLYTTRWFENASGKRQSVVTEVEPINPATGSPWTNNEILISTDPTAEYASVARDGDGDFVVTWSAKTTSGDWNVWYRRFDAMGRSLDDAPKKVNTETDGAQRFAAVAMDNDGDFTITWQSQGQDGSGYGVYAQRFTREGLRLGGLDEIQVLSIVGDPSFAEFALKFNGQVTGSISYTGDLEDLAVRIEQELAALGVEVEAWVPGETDHQVYIRFVGEDGRADQSPILFDYVTIPPSGKLKLSTLVEGEVSEFQVADTTEGNQVFPSIAMDTDGGFVISWTSFGQDGDAPYESNIYAKQYPGNDLVLRQLDVLTHGLGLEHSDPSRIGKPYIVTATNNPDDVLVTPGTGFDGVVRVDNDLGSGSGSLLTSGHHILTAAHVVVDEFLDPLPSNTITVSFFLPAGEVIVPVSEVYVHPDYDGNFLNGNDLAILVLAENAPVGAERYDIYRGTDEVGKEFEKYGYGLTGTGQNGTDESIESGIRRGGENKFDALGSQIEISALTLAYDFDNGQVANDALGVKFGFPDLGLGDEEICAAPGDSGGPSFINGLIAGVTAGGYSVDTGGNTDIDNTPLNSSFGEIGIDIRVSAYADWIDAVVVSSTPEFLVNQRLSGDQKWSDVALDADGDFVITWTSYGWDGGGNGYGSGFWGENGIFARRYTKEADAFGNEFQVNTFTEDNQQHSQVAMDADGDFVITWESFQERPVPNTGPDSPDSYGIYAQRYARNSQIGVNPLLGPFGEIGGELHINGTMLGAQRFPSVTLDGTGDAVFVWSGNGLGDIDGIFTQRFEKPLDDAGPIVTDVHNVLLDAGTAIDVEAVLDSQILYSEVSSFVVTFGENLNTEFEDHGPHSVLNPDHWQLVQILNDGTHQVIEDAIALVEFGLNRALLSGVATQSSNKYEAVITFDRDATVPGEQPLTDGDYILTIRDDITDQFENSLDGNYDGDPGSDFEFTFTVLTSASETLVNDETIGDQDVMDEDQPIEETPNSPQSVDSDADGDYVVVWRSEGPDTGIYAQLYDALWFKNAEGNRESLISESGIIDPITHNPLVQNILVTDDPTATYASVAMDADGDFVVTWTAYKEVRDNAGNIVHDPYTGLPLTEANVYAKWFDATGKAGTDEIQRITFSDIPKTSGATGTLKLGFNGSITTDINVTLSQDPATLAALVANIKAKLLALGIDVSIELGDIWDTTNDDTLFNVSVVARFQGADSELDQPEISLEDVVWNGTPITTTIETALQGVSGEAFRVNTETENDQKFSTIAMDHDGDFVIAWQSDGQDGNGAEVYAQRYNRFGKALGVVDELQVISFNGNPTGTFTLDFGGLTTGQIAFNGDATATATAIQTQLELLGLEVEVEAIGDADIEVRFVGADAGKDQAPLLVASKNISGGPRVDIVTTTSQDGRAGEFRVNQATEGDQLFPAVAMDARGNFVVTWTSYGQDGDAEDETNIYARQFVWIDDVDGEHTVNSGSEFLVNQAILGDQRWSAVAMDQQDDFIITWTTVSLGDPGDDEIIGSEGQQDIFARRFLFQISTEDTPVEPVLAADEFQVNTFTRGTQQHSSISMDANGDFIIGWESFQDRPMPPLGVLNVPNSFGVFTQRYYRREMLGLAGGPNGELGVETEINGTVNRDQRLPSVALDDTGDLVVVWSGTGELKGQEDDQGVYYRHFDQVDDEAGPTVTDVANVFDPEGGPILIEPVVYDQEIDSLVTRFVVTFSEDMNALYGDLGAHSVTNPNFWRLEKNDDVIVGGIHSVQFGLNQAYLSGLSETPSTKYEAIVTFDLNPLTPGLQPLDDGKYLLSVRPDIKDKFGNSLDGDLDGEVGGTFSHEFIVLVGEGGDTPIDQNPVINGRTFPETPGAVDVDEDGDHVVVWTGYDATINRDRVFIRVFNADGESSSLLLPVTPTTETVSDAFDDDIQRYASVATDADGDFVVTWTNYRDADNNTANGHEEVDVYARRYQADGTPIGSAFRVNTHLKNEQKWSSVAMDPDGDFVIAWSSYGQEDPNQFSYGIYARRYDMFGRALGCEFQVNVTTGGDQQFPSVAMDANGAFVIVWQSDQNGVGDDIVLREFTSSGAPVIGPRGGEYVVNDTTDGDQRYPDVAMNLSGDTYAVTWSSSQGTNDQSGFGIYTKSFNRLDATELNVTYGYQGLPVDFDDLTQVWVPIVVDQNFTIRDVNVRLTISHDDPSDLMVQLIGPGVIDPAAGIPAGVVVATLFDEVPRQGDEDGYTSGGPNGTDFDRTVLDDEADLLITDVDNGVLPPFTGEFRPQEPLAVFDGVQGQGIWWLRIIDQDPPSDPDVYIDDEGIRHKYVDGGRLRTWSLEFTLDPVAASPETLVNTTTEGNQLYSSVAMDHQGNFIVVWSGYGDQEDQEDHSQYGVFSQRFNAAASKQGDETRLNAATQGMQWVPSVGMDGEGNFVAVWTGVGVDPATISSLYSYVSANHDPQADIDGPIVSGVELVDGTVLLDGGVVGVNLTSMIIAFGEDLSTKEIVVGGERTPALESILNPNNWVLQRNGTEILGAVSDVAFVWDPDLRRYQAEVTFDGNGMSTGTPGLATGDYTLTIRSLVEDLSGNSLDGDYDGQAGTAPSSFGYDGFHIQFSVPSQDDVLGPERRVSEDPEYYQTLSEPLGTGFARETTNTSVAVDNDGDYVVVWTSYGQDDPTDPNGAGVYFRLYDRNDTQILPTTRVNNITTGHQRNASVAMDADGDFVVVWEAKGSNGTWEVYSQRFNAAGNRIDNLRENRLDQDPNRNQSGVEDIEVLVNSTIANEQYNPAVAMDDFGNFIVVWGTAGQNFSYFNNIFAQRFDYHGQPVGEEFQINQVDEPGTNGPGMVPDFRANPTVALGNDGTFAVAWDQLVEQISGAVSDTNIVVRFFDADALPTTDEIQVNADEVTTRDASHDDPEDATGGTDITRHARNPQVVMGTDGTVIVAFESYQDNDFTGGEDGPDSYGIYYRRFAADGTPLTDGVQQANTVITDDGAVPAQTALANQFAYAQVNAAIGIDANGDFAIFWNGNGANGPDPLDPENPDLVSGHDSDGVFGRWFSSGSDTILSLPTTVQMRVNRTIGGVQQFPSIGMEPDGDVIVVWAGAGVGDQHGIFSRRYDNTTDTAGPLATELRLGDVDDWIGEPNRLLGDGDNVYGNPNSLLVVFDENLNTEMSGPGGTPGLHSVENVNNWALVNGRNEELDGAIHHVTFSFDTTLNKWVAEVFFSDGAGGAGALANGTYTLVARTEIQDLMGNALGLTGYRPNGTGTILAVPVDPDNPDGPTEPIPLDPVTSQRGGFGFLFRVNSTVPGSAPWGDVDQQVNTNNDGIQDAAAVARNSFGESVVVWVDYAEIPDPNADPDDQNPPTILDANIRAQRFDRYGRIRGEEIAVNSLTTGDQLDPDVSMDDQGNFIVVWSGVGEELTELAGIFGQRFDSDGNALGGQFRVNQYINSIQDEPAVAMNRNNSNFVVTWTSFGQDGSRDGVYAREYLLSGQPVGNEFRVNTRTQGAQGTPDVAIDGTGRYVITWASEEQDTSGLGVFAQRYTWGAVPVGAEFRVNTTQMADQFDPAVAMNDHGWFIITWTSEQDGSGYGVYAQRYNEQGAKLGGEFRVNTTTVHDQHQPAVAMSNDVFVVTWTSFNQDYPQDEDVRDNGVYARMFNVADGSDYVDPRVGLVGEFQVNALTEGDQSNPDVAMDAEGHYSIVWSGQDADYIAPSVAPQDPNQGNQGGEEEEPPRGGEPGEPVPTAIYWRLVDPPALEVGDTGTTEMVVQGTAGNDLFEFIGGMVPGSWIVRLNGQVLHVSSNIDAVRFVGGAGQDTVRFTGSSADDTAQLWPDHGTVASQYYTVLAETVESITVTGGGGTDTAHLHDALTGDLFIAGPESSSLTGTGFSLVAELFESVHAYADAGGSDIAKLYDTSGNDTLTTSPTLTEMADSQGLYLAAAHGFEFAYGYSTAGTDSAKMYDSPGKDSLLATADYAKFTGTGFLTMADGFRYVQAFSDAGGADVATLHGSAGNDKFEGHADFAKFYSNEASYAFSNMVTHFENVVASGDPNGNDTAQLLGSAGDDMFVAGRHYGKLFGDGFNIRADFFRSVTGYGNGGDGDIAQLVDSEGNDTLEVYPDYVQLFGADYLNRAFGFANIDARATSTSNDHDVATFYDSEQSNEYLEAEDNWARITSEDYSYLAVSFEKVTAHSSNMGDRKRITPEVDFVLALGLWQDE
ncbi:MAG: trypsin-like serine protease [Pirellulales bacterium]|nr:trypsin-like serine protease [Pirellulales bacterium]